MLVVFLSTHIISSCWIVNVVVKKGRVAVNVTIIYQIIMM